ncbi:MAG: DUF362 domain-containing protein [Desulfobacteraceae bacterium]|nr:DUF362 domain-containing protein [Desulfobacteraceae bacterium]
MKKEDRQEIKIERREFLIRSLQIGCGGIAGLSLSAMLPGCDGGSSSSSSTSSSSSSTTSSSSGGCNPSSNCAGTSVRSGYRPVVSSAWIKKGTHESSYNLYKSMVEAATDFSWLAKNDRVLIKLALNSANAFPATTDPWSLGCMLDLLKEKGAGTILVGDQSGIYQSNSTQTCMNNSGLMSVINAKGATPVYFENGGFFTASAANWSGSVSITNYVNQVDHIIYLPRIATHSLADKTFSLKIAVGFLNSSSRRTMHSGTITNLYPSINDIANIKSRFRLSVTSARKVMTTGGPDSGTIVEPDQGLIFASSDLLAADIMAGAFLEVVKGTTNDIYCHQAVQSYVARNGNIEKLIWDSLNTHPDSTVTNALISSLKKV